MKESLKSCKEEINLLLKKKEEEIQQISTEDKAQIDKLLETHKSSLLTIEKKLSQTRQNQYHVTHKLKQIEKTFNSKNLPACVNEIMKGIPQEKRATQVLDSVCDSTMFDQAGKKLCKKLLLRNAGKKCLDGNYAQRKTPVIKVVLICRELKLSGLYNI